MKGLGMVVIAHKGKLCRFGYQLGAPGRTADN